VRGHPACPRSNAGASGAGKSGAAPGLPDTPPSLRASHAPTALGYTDERSVSNFHIIYANQCLTDN